MSIYKSAVNKPITTIMIFVAIIVVGVYALIKMPVDLYPEIEPPIISVMTTYPGANAGDIETNITKPLEDALNSIDNLDEITSSSTDNISVLTLKFQWESNLDEAANDIRNVIDRVMDNLPEGTDRPTIFKFSTNMMPIVFYAVTAKESYMGLEKLIDEKVINPLNRVDGVGSVAMMGAPRRVVYVDADPNKLDAFNLTVEQIGNVIGSENLNMPSGNVKMGLMDYQLRVEGEFSDSRDLRDLVVGNYAGNIIYLRDVATVKDSLKDVTLDEKINGQTGLRMFVMKQSGANTVKVAREVNENLEKLKKDLPPDVKISQIYDSSDFIKGSINNLSETLMYAFLFVILIVIMFLGRWRATFIIILTIPISLISAFIYLFATGNSINIISLTSLSIAIGMVVDDAIVVLENITRHIERGSSPREAAIYATNEVWLAVIVTTLVIVAVFMPLTLVSGMTGVMFNQLGWIVSITIVVSTIAAITLTPMLSARLLGIDKLSRQTHWYSHSRTIEPLLNKLDDFYVRTLALGLRHKWTVILIGALIFASSLVLFKFVGTDFMPQSDEGRISAAIELQTGTRVEETVKIARKIEAIVKERYPEVTIVSSSSGSDDEGSMFSLWSTTGSNVINLMMRLEDRDKRERTVFDISADLRKQLTGIPEVITSNISTASQSFGGSSNQVDVEIYGYDFDKTNALAEQLKQKISGIKGASDVIISRKKDKPELQIALDRNKIAEHGLNTAMVSAMIHNRVSGLIASKYKEEGDEYDIKVRLTEDSRNSISDLEEMTITSPAGQRIKLKEIASIQEYWGPPSIQHKRKERLVTVSAKPDGIPLGDLAEKINTELKDVQIPKELMVTVGGAYQDQQEAFGDIALLMLISIILVYIVMASQFESLKMPFIIMLSIPFAFSGVAIALFITGTTLSMVAALGAVLLIGIVVKNGIVLVDFINLMRDRGHELNEAIIMSGRSRLRPVLMTALTTILGMFPLALSSGQGSEMWKPMGITVIGGLIFSTIVTMVIVPIMYGIMGKTGERNKKKKIQKQFEFIKNYN
ncbi:MAG TPA: efflux RND transporter permease subunit [Lentimicrobium sp.]|nr:efflux RND transporter permease subunit [Lentimicrobium sp.]